MMRVENNSVPLMSKLRIKSPLNIAIDADPIIDIPLNEMINRTFHIYKEDALMVRQSKERMTEIAQLLLDQMLAATRGLGFEKLGELFSEEHRQQKAKTQELVFNALLGYPNKFQTSVPISKIYTTPDPTKIIKQLTVLTPENAAKFIILKELTFQIYAHEISDECDIVVPQIYGIQFYFNKTNNLVCEFVMDQKDKLPLDFMLDWIDNNEKNDKDKLLTFINGVKQGFNCLNDHAIYHNDSHSNNIFFLQSDTDIPKICIIDFGKAMCSSISPSSSGLTKLDEFEIPEKIIKNFKDWINSEKDQNEYRKMFDERYGGKQNKKRKTYRKRNRKSYKKRKTYRKSYHKTYK
jgi:hypothetical protein